MENLIESAKISENLIKKISENLIKKSPRKYKPYKENKGCPIKKVQKRKIGGNLIKRKSKNKYIKRKSKNKYIKRKRKKRKQGKETNFKGRWGKEEKR